MIFPFFVARRYLFSKQNTNAINIISRISVAVFTIGTAVMIIILSFLNGLEGLVKDLNNAFDPDIKITTKHGKYFEPEEVIPLISGIQGIRVVSKTLEDNVVARYGDAQEIAIVKGVDSAFTKINRIDTLLLSGSIELDNTSNQASALFGGAIASSLNIQVNNLQKPATLFIPTKGVEYNSLNPEASLNSIYIMPTGVILLTEDSDKDMIVIPLAAAQKLFQTNREVSSIEIGLQPEADVETIQKNIQLAIGSRFEVLNQNQQNESAYRVFTTEKWATFAILTLVLLIAAFNTIGALTMLVLEKKKDINILISMGANPSVIRKIFLFEGLLITVGGIVIGLILGTAFVWLQQEVGIVRLEGSFVDFFPIKLKFYDFVYIVLIILFLGLIASIYPAWKSVGDNLKSVKIQRT